MSAPRVFDSQYMDKLQATLSLVTEASQSENSTTKKARQSL